MDQVTPVNPCDQPLDEAGRLKPECRVERAAPTPRTRSRRAAVEGVDGVEEPASRPVGLIAAMYGVMFAGGAVVPTFAFTASAGVRFRSGVGIVGLAHGTIVVNSIGSAQLYGIGPAIRFGNRSHVSLGLSPTLGIVTGQLQAVGLMLSIYAQFVLVLGDHFSLLAAPVVHFDASGVIGVITGGLGVTF